MSFLTLHLASFAYLIRVAMGPSTPMNLRHRSLLLKRVVVVANLIVRTLRVDATVLASVCHLHLQLLHIDLTTSSMLRLLIVLYAILA